MNGEPIPVITPQTAATIVHAVTSRARTQALRRFLRDAEAGRIATAGKCAHDVPLLASESSKSGVCPVCQLPTEPKLSQLSHAWNILLAAQGLATHDEIGLLVGGKRVLQFGKPRPRGGAFNEHGAELNSDGDDLGSGLIEDKAAFEQWRKGRVYGDMRSPQYANRNRADIPLAELQSLPASYLARKYGISRQAVNAKKRKWAKLADMCSPEELDALISLKKAA